MKAGLSFFLLIHTIIICAAEPTTQPPQAALQYPSITINNNLSADTSNSSATRAASFSVSDAINQNSQTTVTYLKNEIVALFEQLQLNKWKSSAHDAASALKNRTMGLIEQTKTLVYDHKYKFMAALLGCIYGYLYWNTLQSKHYLERTDLLSSWQENIPLEELREQPNKKIAQQFMVEVQKRFVNQENPTDFLYPLVQFMQEADLEMKQLKRYKKIHAWSKRMFLYMFITIDEQIFETIDKRIERLLFFKNAFASWVANYKMIQNKPRKLPHGVAA